MQRGSGLNSRKTLDGIMMNRPPLKNRCLPELTSSNLRIKNFIKNQSQVNLFSIALTILDLVLPKFYL